MRPPHSLLLASLAVALVLAACAAQTGTPQASATVPADSSVPAPQRQPLLRVAVFGDATTTNVWELFDEQGASYWNYATQSSYWPRLYHVSPLTRTIEPVVAGGSIPPVLCDSTGCTATVSLLPGLKWTDGTPLTAQDVAFTADTAIRFQLGLAWREAYDPEYLDRVEAVDENTVRYFFHTPPGVATWQYGALQGPIVNQEYWQPRIADAVARLPEDTLAQSVQDLQARSLEMRAQMEKLGLSLNTMAPASQAYQETASQATHIQEDLNSVNQQLDKALDEYESKLTDARQALFGLGNAGEPTLGPWRFKDRLPGELENTAVFGTPLGDPWFDSVVYTRFADEPAAVQALLANEVDVILSPSGLSAQSVTQLKAAPEITLTSNLTRSARFLAFNHANPYLADKSLHRALACVLEPQELVAWLDGAVAALPVFSLESGWQDTAPRLPCQGETGAARQEQALQILAAAGYTWEQGPDAGSAPVGLIAPDGSALPAFSLLVPAQDYDRLRASAAAYIAEQARTLGIIVDVQPGDADSVVYAVYGSGEYDIALLGWQLSSYPAYLCAWFDTLGENPFAYDTTRLKPACDAWRRTADLGQARAHAVEVQSILTEDLPLIPLFVVVRHDAYRNVRYPFGGMIDGLADLYAAPELAVPFR